MYRGTIIHHRTPLFNETGPVPAMRPPHKNTCSHHQKKSAWQLDFVALRSIFPHVDFSKIRSRVKRTEFLHICSRSPSERAQKISCFFCVYESRAFKNNFPHTSMCICAYVHMCLSAYVLMRGLPLPAFMLPVGENRLFV